MSETIHVDELVSMDFYRGAVSAVKFRFDNINAVPKISMGIKTGGCVVIF